MRVLFHRVVSPYRLVRGEIIRKAQEELKKAGFDPVSVDGIYGADTVNALRPWQAAQHLPASGQIDVDTWKRLMSPHVPSLFHRCLQLTAEFEGTGFGKVVGNFDGAWLTWGIIGFTLSNGELQRLLARVAQEHPQLFTRAFGGLEPKIRSVVGAAPSLQRDWANSISVGSNKYNVQPEWVAAFAALGAFPEVQALQLERAEHRYWATARRDAERFGLSSELGYALCFDIAVQNGGIEAHEERHIRQLAAAHPPANEQALRVMIADVVAEDSAPVWVEDVRRRKRTIATGDGAVHDSRYLVAAWGLAEEAAS